MVKFCEDFVDSLVFFTLIMSPENKEFFSSFSICEHFVSFYCLITAVRTSNAMLPGGQNNSAKRRHPCFVRG